MYFPHPVSRIIKLHAFFSVTLKPTADYARIKKKRKRDQGTEVDSRDPRRSAQELGSSQVPFSPHLRRFGGSEAHCLHLRFRGAAALTRGGCVRPLVDRGGTAESPRAGWGLEELPGVGVEENDLTWAPGVEIAWPGTS